MQPVEFHPDLILLIGTKTGNIREAIQELLPSGIRIDACGQSETSGLQLLYTV
jgi:hypothetical protein